jgi:hypothetical protein
MSTSPSRLTTQKEDGANPFDLLVAVAKNAAALSYDRRTMPAWQPLSMFCYAPAP